MMESFKANTIPLHPHPFLLSLLCSGIILPLSSEKAACAFSIASRETISSNTVLARRLSSSSSMLVEYFCTSARICSSLLLRNSVNLSPLPVDSTNDSANFTSPSASLSTLIRSIISSTSSSWSNVSYLSNASGMNLVAYS